MKEEYLTPAKLEKSQRFHKIKERYSNPHHKDNQEFKKIEILEEEVFQPSYPQSASKRPKRDPSLFETDLQAISEVLSSVKHTVDAITSQGFIDTHRKIRAASLRKQSSADRSDGPSQTSFAPCTLAKASDGGGPILILRQVRSQDSSLTGEC